MGEKIKATVGREDIVTRARREIDEHAKLGGQGCPMTPAGDVLALDSIITQLERSVERHARRGDAGIEQARLWHERFGALETALQACYELVGYEGSTLAGAAPILTAIRELRRPIPMRLPCPSCHELHVDRGRFATLPHHTHACQACGMTWRPAVVCTVGVQFLPGFRDDPISCPICHCVLTGHAPDCPLDQSVGWTCSQCGDSFVGGELPDPTWRWTGRAFEHACGPAQAGHFPAVRTVMDPDPIPSPAARPEAARRRLDVEDPLALRSRLAFARELAEPESAGPSEVPLPPLADIQPQVLRAILDPVGCSLEDFATAQELGLVEASGDGRRRARKPRAYQILNPIFAVVEKAAYWAPEVLDEMICTTLGVESPWSPVCQAVKSILEADRRTSDGGGA